MQTRALRRIAGLTLSLAAAFAACDQRPTSPDRVRAERQSLAADQDSGTVEFEGEVSSVDTAGGTLTLVDSTVVAVDSATEWDSAGDYGSLAEIAAALSDTTDDAPDAVVAEGEGSEQADGSVLASEIEAEAEEEEPAEFEGAVASVDLDSGTVTLDDSTVVRVDASTTWDSTGDYTSLEEIAAALEDDSAADDTTSGGSGTSGSTGAGFFASDTTAGDTATASDSTSTNSTTTVVVEGEGEEQAEGAILASEIKAEAEGDEEDEPVEFEGEVSSVDVDSSTLALEDSTVVRVDSTTEWDSTGDYTSLEEIAAELKDSASDDTASGGGTSGSTSAGFFASDTASGDTTTASDSTSTDSATTVVVEGEGETQADGSLLASKIKAEGEDRDDGEGKPTAGEEVEFEGDVLAVHGKSEHHQLNLEGGQRIAVDSATEWTGAYGSLDAVAAAVDSGRTVKAEGSGVEQHDGSVVADEIEAAPRTVDFSGEVASVNPKNGNHQVRLDDGTRLEVPDDASWSGDASSLAELDTAADTASSVSVEGEGTQGRNGVITVTEIEVEISDDSGDQGGKGSRGGQGNSGNGNGQGGSGSSGGSGSGNGQGQGNGGGNNGNGNGQGQGNGNNGKGKGGGGGKGKGGGD